jgi:uncharacterized LabA/DUF88 family protein
MFGCTHPNYDVEKLARAVCAPRGWQLDKVFFYTGVPSASDNVLWSTFWDNKLAALNRNPLVQVYRRSLVYRAKKIEVPGFGEHTVEIGQEKGIDVRLALDVLDTAHRNLFDVAVIFSQDQDLNELVRLIHAVSASEKRWLKIASAYPFNGSTGNKRGINNTDWCPIDRATYESCIDPHDYR